MRRKNLQDFPQLIYIDMNGCCIDYTPAIIRAATNLKTLIIKGHNLFVHQQNLIQKPELNVRGIGDKCADKGDIILNCIYFETDHEKYCYS